MNELFTALLIGAAVVVVVLSPLALLSCCLPDQVPPEQRAAEFSERLRIDALEDDLETRYWPLNWPHERPDRRLSVTEAHAAVQRHRDCAASECPRKRAALQVLVETGRARLDPRGYH